MIKRVRTDVATEDARRTIPTRAEMKAAFDEDGFMVLSQVLTGEQCDQVLKLFWDYTESMCPGVDRNDLSTWNSKTRFPNQGGLIQHGCVGWQAPSVMVRDLTKHVFAELWGTDDLWTSIDGVSATMKHPTPRFVPFESVDDWDARKWADTSVHVDQTTPGLLSIQAGVAITDQREDEHVFTCIPGSHKHHEHLLSLGPAKKTLHWEIMNEAQLEYLRSQSLDMIRVPLRAGDMVLWDSRTVHSSAKYCKTARTDAFRLQVFVCMLPAPIDPRVRAAEIAKRRAAYEKGLTGKHSPWPLRPFGAKPRLYSKEDDERFLSFKIPAPVELTEEQKKLHGLM